MNLRFGRQREVEDCATFYVPSRPKSATMRLDDRVADSQPHTSAFSFCGDESVEDFFHLISRYSHACVTNGYQHLSGVASGAYLELAAALAHCLHPVEHQVH